MNCIRKTAAGTAAILLSLTMAACHQTAPSSVTTVATMPESSKSTLAAVQVQGGEELDKLLDQVEDNVFPGTAGCSLTAVRYTVSLLDWCKTAGVSDTELRSDLTAWVQGKDTVELARKFELVMDVYDRLMGDSAQDLLDTAGVQTDNYPWPESCRQMMQTILEVTGGVSSTDHSGLDLILEDIRDNWDETQAGSTRQAVELLDWAVGSSASEERIRVTVTDWMEPMGNDEQNDFAVGLARVKRFCELLQSAERQKLLEKAELEDRQWPVTALQKVDIILDAAGAKGDSGFLGLLNRIADGSEDRTALAVELLDWAQTTALDRDGIWYLGKSWSYAMDSDTYNSFQDQMDSLLGLCDQLQEKPELLAEKRIEEHTWSQEALDHIETLFQATGDGTICYK